MILMKNQANQFRQYFVPSIQQHYLPFSDKCPELVDLDSTEETLSKRPVDSQVLQEKKGHTQKQYRSRSEDWCNGSWRAQHCLLVGQRETRVAGDGDRLLRLSCVCVCVRWLVPRLAAIACGHARNPGNGRCLRARHSKKQ